jgi:hypothetical protein
MSKRKGNNREEERDEIKDWLGENNWRSVA